MIPLLSYGGGGGGELFKQCKGGGGGKAEDCFEVEQAAAPPPRETACKYIAGALASMRPINCSLVPCMGAVYGHGTREQLMGLAARPSSRDRRCAVALARDIAAHQDGKAARGGASSSQAIVAIDESRFLRRQGLLIPLPLAAATRRWRQARDRARGWPKTRMATAPHPPAASSMLPAHHSTCACAH